MKLLHFNVILLHGNSCPFRKGALVVVHSFKNILILDYYPDNAYNDLNLEHIFFNNLFLIDLSYGRNVRFMLYRSLRETTESTGLPPHCLSVSLPSLPLPSSVCMCVVYACTRMWVGLPVYVQRSEENIRRPVLLLFALFF